jgi:hypothetical protein
MVLAAAMLMEQAAKIVRRRRCRFIAIGRAVRLVVIQGDR